MPDAVTGTWVPDPERVAATNVARLMRRHGIAGLAELRRRSVEDTSWYWDAVVDDLGIPFSVPYERVVDERAGAPWARWFAGGQVNVAHACVDRWRDDPQTADCLAVVAESEDGTVRTLTFGELGVEVDALARALAGDGFGPGDAIGVFMPMIPEAVVAAYAIASIGAVWIPLFSGLAPDAIAARLVDSDARAVICADGTWRRGRRRALKPALDDALSHAPAVRRVVVADRLGLDAPLCAGRDAVWDDYTAEEPSRCGAAATGAEDVLMLAYRPGTTARPAAAVHVHGGFLVKVASEAAYQTDLRAGDCALWITDMGSIMGAWLMVGAHANGATMVLYEGDPDHPQPDRLWALVARHRITMLGASPTLVRALRAAGDQWTDGHDLSSLRVLGATGETWDAQAWEWLMRATGRRAPIITFASAIEVGTCLLSPYPVEPISPCSLGGISLGMDVDVLDAAGAPVRGTIGELVCRRPWPAMTRGLWRDPNRYRQTYWSTYPGVWRQGERAKIDADGQWSLYGRFDRAISREAA